MNNPYSRINGVCIDGKFYAVVEDCDQEQTVTYRCISLERLRLLLIGMAECDIITGVQASMIINRAKKYVEAD